MCDFEIQPIERSEGGGAVERVPDREAERTRDEAPEAAPEQKSEARSERAAEKEAKEKLDDATVEPRSFVEGRSDYKQAESIQRDFAAVTDDFAARETGATTEQSAREETRQESKDAGVTPTSQERQYGVVIGDDERSTIALGDGEQGARLPIDPESPKADYRASTRADGDRRGGREQVETLPGPLPHPAEEKEVSGLRARASIGTAAETTIGTVSDDEEGGPQANAAMRPGGDLRSEKWTEAAFGPAGDAVSDDEEGGPQAHTASEPGGDLRFEKWNEAAFGPAGDLVSDDEEGGPQANAASELGGDLVSDDEEGGPQANTAMRPGGDLDAEGLHGDEAVQAADQQALNDQQLKKARAGKL